MLVETNHNEHEQLAQQVLEEGAQFIKSVAHSSGRREILANSDIYAANGIKLISSGTRLSEAFQERLVAHKLLKPIEESLQVADALDPQKLVSLAHAEALRLPALAALLNPGELFEHLGTSIGRLTLPPPLAFKLTLMQEERPALFRHSLIVLVLSVTLGIRARLPADELQALAGAAIFHDIGEMYIDPLLFAPGHIIDSDEQRFLFTHPLTGSLMLRNFRNLPEATASCVSQHHERLDGSGYPHGLQGPEIGKLARYLAVAEFVASLLEKNGVDHRISMKLRLNFNKLDPIPADIMCDLFSDAKAASSPAPDTAYLATSLTLAGKIFEEWTTFVDSLAPTVRADIAYFTRRLDDLRRMVLEPGYDACRLDELLPDGGNDDAEIRLELAVLLDEVSWQLNDISRIFERKLADRGWSLPIPRREEFLEWMGRVRQFTER